MVFEQYCRTVKGNHTLQNRSVKLDSRQRALLLMIESRQITNLQQQQLKQLATPVNLAVLLEHQLIAPIGSCAQPTRDAVELSIPQPPITTIPKTINEALAAPVAITEVCKQHHTISSDLHTAAMIQEEPHYLELDSVKQLMIAALQTYCGLLASGLIREIEQAHSISKLRLCQMRWVTTLTETRATHAQIAAWMAQINESLDSLRDNAVKPLEAMTVSIF